MSLMLRENVASPDQIFLLLQLTIVKENAMHPRKKTADYLTDTISVAAHVERQEISARLMVCFRDSFVILI